MDAKKSRSLFAAGQPVGARHRRRLGLLPRHGRVLRPTRPPQPESSCLCVGTVTNPQGIGMLCCIMLQAATAVLALRLPCTRWVRRALAYLALTPTIVGHCFLAALVRLFLVNNPDKLQATYEFADPAPILAWTIGLALHRHSSPSHLVGGVGGDCGKKPGWKAERADPESMEAKSASGADERSKSISVAEEARIIKKHLLAALIKHAFNFFFVVVLAGYIICMYGALKYYPLLYAIMGIAFMSPYFVTMLKMLPLLKGFYIERYATDPVMPM